MEDPLQVLEVLFVGIRIYSDFIQIDYDKISLFLRKCYIHHPIESIFRVHQTKRHLGIHERPPWCRKSHLFPVIQVDHDSIITQKTIQHEHLLGPHYFLQDIVHFREWVVVLEGHFVQFSKIHTQSYFFALFSYKHQVFHPLRKP